MLDLADITCETTQSYKNLHSLWSYKTNPVKTSTKKQLSEAVTHKSAQ